MGDNLFDFATDDSQAGFRLERFQLFNWGTFDQKVWTLECGGENTLLTGDIGSGKSTLVDAITTLLVPPQKLSYNKAAGAEARERNLRSYVLGHFKSERSETGTSSRAVALRDHNSYSVILGQFRNAGYGTSLCLAQVFWIRDQGQPARFYLTSTKALDLARDFSGFGSDLADLKKKLRAMDGVEIHESFTSYAAAFRRVFGIDNEQALDLFNQTVSMKSVGNLTDFVREHMIEPFDAESRIKALLEHFADLNQAHETVLKAKARIEALEPLLESGKAWQDGNTLRDHYRANRDALSSWFAFQKKVLAHKRLDRLTEEAQRLTAKRESERARRMAMLSDRDSLKAAISANGGERLDQLSRDIEQTRTERNKRQARMERYRGEVEALDLVLARDSDAFLAIRGQVEHLRIELSDSEAREQNERTEHEHQFRQLNNEHRTIQAEITSLKNRQSNIPSLQVEIRARLCADLHIPLASIPFAGEVLRVRAGEGLWEGAIERVLHNFALSLLVGDSLYQKVCAWVDSNNLGGRLVYYRVRESDTFLEQADRKLHPQSLVNKLDIKADSPFADWLERELSRRFDYACTDSLEQFYRERQAIRPSGQVKGSGERHEKDDRHRIDDSTRWVLGWTNHGKIRLLEQEIKKLEGTMQVSAQAISDCEARQGLIRKRQHHCTALEGFTDWTELDWEAMGKRLADLEAERKSLESSADQLKTLRTKLETLEQDLSESESVLEDLAKGLAVANNKASDTQKLLDSLQLILDGPTSAEHQRSWPALETMAQERDTLRTLTIESADNKEREFREIIQQTIDNEDRRLSRLREKVIRAMEDFRNRWPLETREIDASLDGLSHWAKILDQLLADDLPRFEADFKTALNENAIREVANFHSQLNREREDIRERIEHINESLVHIDYNPGRYIVLEAQNSTDPEIRQFLTDLKSCTEGSFTDKVDEQYAEVKFLQVKALIERFQGREGLVDLDRRWTRKVSDVRQYFVFSASERYREDNTEHEHYTDSGGKSGGQKEKLAYTVLAASLAYQFGLDWDSQRSRSFRFVMIDEAFGRGSDESARFGLRLFQQLRLQLLVITPLQKIHIIEPFVASVGFVHNPDGQRSYLRNLSIAEYRAERDARKT